MEWAFYKMWNQFQHNQILENNSLAIENFQYSKDRMDLAMMNNSIQNNQCDIARYYYNYNYNARIKIAIGTFS